MDESEILLSALYTNAPAGVSTKKVDAVFNDWKIAKGRGENVTFAEMLVRRGVLKKGQPEAIVWEMKNSSKQSQIKDEGSKSRTPVAKADGSKSRTPVAKAEGSKSRTPVAKAPPSPAKKKSGIGSTWTGTLGIAALAGILTILAWRNFAPKPAPLLADNTPDPTRKKPPAPTRPWTLDDPFETREKASARVEEAAVAQGLRDLNAKLLEEAKKGNPEAAEKKLDEAIAAAADPGEKEQLEQLRWEIHVIKKEREKARKAIDEAKKQVAGGDDDAARKAVEGADPPEGTPEREEIEKAKAGAGELAKAVKPQRPTPGQLGQGPVAKGELPPPEETEEAPGLPEPVTPSEEPGGDDGAPIGGELALTPKLPTTRKNGLRPHGQAQGKELVHSFVDEVDENPEIDAPPIKPELVKVEVPPVPVLSPRAVEAARADELARVTSEGLVYLAKVKGWLDEQTSYRSGALAREMQRVREATSETSRFLRRIEVPGGLTLSDAHVSEYDARGFSLKDQHATWGSSWRNNPEIALEVRKLAIDPDEPRDSLRFGRWCARTGYFPQARKAFEKARAMDPSLARRIPDLDALEKQSRVFNGKLSRQGQAIRLVWDFDSPRELEDFGRDGLVGIGNGHLLLEARAAAAKAQGLTPIVVAGRCSLDARIEAGPGVLVLGFIVQGTDSDAPVTRMVLVRYDGETGKTIVAMGNSIIAVGQGGVRARYVHIELSRDAIEVRVGIGYHRIPFVFPQTFRVVPVVASAVSLVAVDQLTLAANADREWLDQTLGDTAFRVALLLEETIGAPPFAYSRPLQDLTAEIASVATNMTPVILEQYKKVKTDIVVRKKALRDGASRMYGIGIVSPGYAPAWYWLARYAYEIDHCAFAIECLNKAVTATGGFAEALSFRARVLAQLRRLEEAEVDLKTALALRPDLATIHEDAAAVAFEEQDLERARSELELAFALDPVRSLEAEEEIPWVSHVLEGPPFAKPVKLETENYLWTSSLKEEKVQRFASALEEMRPNYFDMLRVKPRDEKRKSIIMLFDSNESFLDYNRIARHARAEGMNGFFHSLTKELELFQQENDPTGEGTASTLFHEGFHQYFDRILGGRNIPYWANEGLGDYFGTTGVLHFYGKPGRKHRGRLRNLFESGPPLPVDVLMADPPQDFMTHATQRYAQAWTVVHYIMEGDHSRWKPLLKAYLEHLRAGRSPVNAYNRTFGRIDMDEFEEGWRKHVMKLRDEVNANR
jgi:tetratricopeptide (TPR) repeat protein